MTVWLLQFRLLTEDLNDEQDDEAKKDRNELEETRQVFLSLSVENFEHDDVEQSSSRQALQCVDHQIRDTTGTDLCDDDPAGNTQAAGEAEDGKVGVEDELLGAGLQQLQADAEGDDKLVSGDGCNYNYLHQIFLNS